MLTPPYALEPVRELLGGIGLDPCTEPDNPTRADKWYSLPADGCALPWDAPTVWCNPPYGKALKAWLNKLALHGNGIALVFARTETEAFFGHAWPYASAMLFLRGRLTFAYPDGSLPRNGANSGGPSVLIGYGDEAERRLLSCEDLGAVVKRVTTDNVEVQRRP